MEVLYFLFSPAFAKAVDNKYKKYKIHHHHHHHHQEKGGWKERRWKLMVKESVKKEAGRQWVEEVRGETILDNMGVGNSTG